MSGTVSSISSSSSFPLCSVCLSVLCTAIAMTSTTAVSKKIFKSKDEQPSELEEAVAKAFVELEMTSKEMATELRDLFFLSAKQIDLSPAASTSSSTAPTTGISTGKAALIIFVPYRFHKRFQKLQSRLIRELEKKFSGKHVIILAQRTIMSKQYNRQHPGQIRPRSRTLTAVHQAILDDLVYPTQVVGKRIRFRTDGSRLLKVYLDPKDVKEVDYKLKTFASVYKKLTNKNIEFLFPPTD